MTKMTPKERETIVMEGGTPDRVPVFQINGIVASQYFGYLWKDLRFDAKLSVETTRKFARLAGTDVLVLAGVEPNAIFMDLPGMDVKLVDNNYSNVMSHYFIEPEDVETKPFYDPEDSTEAEFMWKALMNKTILLAEKEDEFNTQINTWGVMTTGGHLRNVENLMMDSMLEPELAHKVLARAEELVDGVMRVGLERGSDVAFFGEPTSSGSLVSGDMFEEFCSPHLKRMIAGYKRDYGAKSYIHICGESLPVAEKVKEIGAALFSFDYVTEIEGIKKIMGDSMCIAGNLDPMNVVWMGTPEHVMEKSKECIEQGEGSRFFLATGCETPRDTPIENLQAMLKAVETYGRY